MCQQKPIVLLSSAQDVKTHPSLALPDRQSPVPDNLMSLNTEEYKDIKMEGGGMLPPTPIIQTSLLSRTHLCRNIQRRVKIMRFMNLLIGRQNTTIVIMVAKTPLENKATHTINVAAQVKKGQ